MLYLSTLHATTVALSVLKVLNEVVSSTCPSRENYDYLSRWPTIHIQNVSVALGHPVCVNLNVKVIYEIKPALLTQSKVQFYFISSK